MRREVKMHTLDRGTAALGPGFPPKIRPSSPGNIDMVLPSQMGVLSPNPTINVDGQGLTMHWRRKDLIAVLHESSKPLFLPCQIHTTVSLFFGHTSQATGEAVRGIHPSPHPPLRTEFTSTNRWCS